MSDIKKPEWELRMDRVEKGFEETKEILREIAKSSGERSKEFDKRSKEFDERFKSNGDDLDKTRKAPDERRKSSDEDFAKIRKTLDEIAKSNKEFDERRKSRDEDFERMRKNLEEVGKKLDKTASAVNGIGDSNGIIAEEFFMETTREGLPIDGFGHLDQKNCNYIIYDSDKNKRAEFDIVFTNDNFIFIVEVKYRLDKKHEACFTEQKKKGVDEGLNRLEIFEKYDGEWIGNRTIVAAFACLGAREEVIEAFKEKGYYVLVREPNDTYRLFSPND